MVYSEAFRGSRNSACTLDWTLRPNSIEMDGTVLSKPIKRGFEALFSHSLYTDHSCLARYLTLFPQNVCVSLIPAVEKSDDNDGIFVVLKNDVNEVFKAASRAAFKVDCRWEWAEWDNNNLQMDSSIQI